MSKKNESIFESDKGNKTLIGAINADVLKFTVGEDPVLDLNLVEWDCIASAAHVTMLSKIPVNPILFTREERDAVVAEYVNIIRASRKGEFKITEEDQDCHLAIERTLTEKLGALGKRVHTGRSRNDQSATAIRLYSIDQLIGMYLECLDLASSLVAFGKKNRALPMVGRTHLQPAMPSSVGVWATAYAEELFETLADVVFGALTFTDGSPLGSAASYGVPLPIDRQMTAYYMCFRQNIHSVLAAGNSRGKTESVIISALAQVMITISRLAQDLILFSMPEFGYFSIPREFCTGSSIMPQKYNPDVCELIRSKAAQVVGLSTTACGIMVGMPGGYNRDLQDTKKILMEAFDTTRATVRIMSCLIGGLKAHPDKLRAAFRDPGVFATDRALELVAGGMAFRDAYHEVREHLEDLSGMDPDETIAKKTHLGAPFGLDFAMYESAIRRNRSDMQKMIRERNRRYTELLGVPYPELPEE